MLTLSPAGELGLDEMAELCDVIVSEACAGELVIELDLGDVTHFDFRGARMLAARRRFMHAAGGDLILRRPSRYIVAILAATGQLEAIGLAPTDPPPESLLTPYA